MGALLRAELIKLRTTRTFAALAGTAIALSLLITVLVASLSEPTEEAVLGEVFSNDVTNLFILVLGVVGITGEWRHRTITSSLLAAPDRARFLAAKVIAYAAAGLVLYVVISLLLAIVGLIILGARDLPQPGFSELAGQLWRGGLLAALVGAFGVAVGTLVRNQAVAVVALLVFGFIVEPAVIALAPEVGRFGPVLAAPEAVINTEETAGFELGGNSLLSPGAGVLVMLLWIAGTGALGALLLRRRDLSG